MYKTVRAIPAARWEKKENRNSIDSNPPVLYRFPDAASDSTLTRDRAVELAGLCDRINSAVYLQYLRPVGEPLSVASLISETYDLPGTVWHVSLDSMEDDGETLTLLLTAAPEN